MTQFDEPTFEQGPYERPATLRQMVLWAYHVHRSDPFTYTPLLLTPEPKRVAAQLWQAHRDARPIPEQMELATKFNEAMVALRHLAAQPKGDKPTVGKASDRFGAKQKLADKKASERAARRELTKRGAA